MALIGRCICSGPDHAAVAEWALWAAVGVRLRVDLVGAGCVGSVIIAPIGDFTGAAASASDFRHRSSKGHPLVRFASIKGFMFSYFSHAALPIHLPAASRNRSAV
jgi:hypothetical protein